MLGNTAAIMGYEYFIVNKLGKHLRRARHARGIIENTYEEGGITSDNRKQMALSAVYA